MNVLRCALRVMGLLLILWSEVSGAPQELPRVLASDAPWNYSAFKVAERYESLVGANVNGATEIFFSANDIWQALRWDAGTGTARTVHVSQVHRVGDEFFKGVGFVRHGDINNDGKREVIVGLLDGSIHAYDEETKAEIGAIYLERYIGSSHMFRSALLVDIDRDGEQELVILTESELLIIDRLQYFPSVLVSVKEISGFGGYRFYVGQLDADAPLEILFGGGAIVEVGRWKEEWHLLDLNDNYLKVLGLVDRDHDGISEILVQRSNGVSLQTFDLASRTERWSTNLDVNIGFSALLQLDSDPALELVCSGAFGTLRAFDTDSGAEEWVVKIPEGSSPQAFAAIDVDQDGVVELVVTRVADILILKPGENRVLWRSPDPWYFSSKPLIGDIDGDGKDEMVFANTVGISVIDLKTAQQIAQYPLGSWEAQSLRLRDVTGDGRPEILLACTFHDLKRSIRVYQYSADKQFTKLWEKEFTTSSSDFDEFVSGFDAADLDGDGTLEFALGIFRTKPEWGPKSQPWGGRVEVIDYPSGEVLWTSPNVKADFADLRVEDFNKDGVPDIGAVFDQKSLCIWDGETRRKILNLRGNFTSFARLSDGLVAGHASGHISRFKSRGKRFGRVLYKRTVRDKIFGIVPAKDESALWLTGTTEAIYWPWRPTGAFAIENGNVNYDPPQVTLHESPEGDWLFLSYSRLIRGFPFGPE